MGESPKVSGDTHPLPDKAQKGIGKCVTPKAIVA